MSDDLEQALRLTGDIYDAALDPGLWPEVLHRIGDFVGGPATALFSHDIATVTQRFHFIWGDNPEYTRSYNEKYGRMNPALPIFSMMRAGEVWSVARVMPMRQFHQTRFYLEWVKPQGFGDVVGSLIERSGAVVTTLATSVDERRSPVGEAATRRMTLIVPHVKRAVAIGGVIEMARIEADTLGDAVDAIGAAVFFVHEHGRVIRANAAGRALAASGTVLRLDGGQLGTVEASGRRELSRAISGAAAGDLIIGRSGIAVPLLDRDGERYVAHVLPLTAGLRRRAGLAVGAVAAVFVRKAVMDTMLPLEALSRHFDLSPAELRVLVAGLEFGAPAEVAPILGLSEATVRTHLRRLYEKTGSSGQAGLVKLVAGYASPFAAPASSPN